MKANLLIAILCAFLGFATFFIKNQVTSINNRISEINFYTNSHLRDIQILKAEIIYLSNPSRILELNEKYLKLTPITVSQFATDKTLGDKEFSAKTQDVFKALSQKNNVTKTNQKIVNANNKKITLQTVKNKIDNKWNYKHTNFQAFLGK